MSHAAAEIDVKRTSPKSGASPGLAQRLLRGCQRIEARQDWCDLLGPGWPDRIMQMRATDRFHEKQGRSTGRLILAEDGRRLTVYLKRHYRLPWWLGWLATLWPGKGWSPAWQEFEHLDWAREHGIPVPASVAVGEHIGPWGKLQSFLAIEELTDMLPLHEAIPRAANLLVATDFQAWKRGLVIEVARLSRILHSRRFFHGDLYLCHFFIHQSDLAADIDWTGRVHMIDLHRLSRSRWPYWRVKDLAELLYSSEIVGVNARDRLRFWRNYLAGARKTIWARWLARAIRLKAYYLQRHHDKKMADEKLSLSTDRGQRTTDVV